MTESGSPLGDSPTDGLAESIRRHPAWHARPGANVVLSDRDIAALLEAHDNAACREIRCPMRAYLIEVRDRRLGGGR